VGLGPELVTEGAFDNGGAAWTLVNNVAIVGEQAVWDIEETRSGTLYQSISIVSGKTYRVTFDLYNFNPVGELFDARLGGQVFTTENGANSRDVVAGSSNSDIVFIGGDQGGNIGCELDNVSVKEIVSGGVISGLMDLVYEDD
jgi:hypothetical protein